MAYTFNTTEYESWVSFSWSEQRNVPPWANIFLLSEDPAYDVHYRQTVNTTWKKSTVKHEVK